MRNNKSLSGYIKRYLFVVSCIVVVIISGYSIASEIYRFESNSERLKHDVLEERKMHVKHQVDAAIAGIEFVKSDVFANFHKNIQERVNEAYDRLESIYNKYKNILPEEKLKKILTEALRYDRFFTGRGYYYIFDTDGKGVLTPLNPFIEGRSILHSNYSNNEFPIVEILKTLENKESAFVNYNWQGHNISDKRIYKKTAFVRKLPFYNWILGTGDYSKDIEKEVQELAIKKLKAIRYDKYGYVFVNTYDGKAVVINSKTHKRGDDIRDIVDPDGVRIFEEELKQAVKPEGGYIYYKWFEPGMDRYVRKISFIKGVDDWQWLLGAFTDLSLIDDLIEQNKKNLYFDLYKRTGLILLLLIVTLLLMYLLSSYLKRKVDFAFNSISLELRDAIKQKRLIDPSKFVYRENLALVSQTNIVLDLQHSLDEEVSNKQRFLQTLIDKIPITVFYKDIYGVYKGCNDAYCQFLGKEKDDIVGKNLFEVFSEKQAEFFKQADDKLFTNGGIQVYDTVMKGNDGKIRHVNFHKAVYHNRNGEVGGMIGAMIDITDRVKIQEELKKKELTLIDLNKTKDRFFSIIAHDLKNPFNSLLGMLDILIDEYDDLDDSTKKEYLNIVNNSSNNLYRLLTNLLEWSRAQISSVDFNPIVTNLYDVIMPELKILENQANDKKIKIEVDVPEKICANVDRNMFATIVRNLVSNAIKFTPRGGEVNVIVAESSNSVSFIVIDNGLGISKEKQLKLFKIHEKVSSQGTDNESGTGLGLILCREFIDKHNGSISVSSEEGLGTKFCVKISK